LNRCQGKGKEAAEIAEISEEEGEKEGDSARETRKWKNTSKNRNERGMGRDGGISGDARPPEAAPALWLHFLGSWLPGLPRRSSLVFSFCSFFFLGDLGTSLSGSSPLPQRCRGLPEPSIRPTGAG
jgi:hypothetical protein